MIFLMSKASSGGVRFAKSFLQNPQEREVLDNTLHPLIGQLSEQRIRGGTSTCLPLYGVRSTSVE